MHACKGVQDAAASPVRASSSGSLAPFLIWLALFYGAWFWDSMGGTLYFWAVALFTLALGTVLILDGVGWFLGRPLVRVGL